MNCFCGMDNRRKTFSLISSRNHCQRSSLLWIYGMPWVGFEPEQSLSSGLVKWSRAVVIQRYCSISVIKVFVLTFDSFDSWIFDADLTYFDCAAIKYLWQKKVCLINLKWSLLQFLCTFIKWRLKKIIIFCMSIFDLVFIFDV